MKKLFTWLTGLIFLFGSAQLAGAEEALRIGLALPLSGVGAPYGAAYLNGLMLELSKNSTAVRLQTEDHQYDNKSAISAVRKLAQIDKVNLVVVWGYAPSDAVAPIVSKDGPLFLLGSLNPVGRLRPEILNLSAPLEVTLAPLVKRLRSGNVRKTALVASQIGAMHQSARALQSALQARMPDTIDRLLPDQLDFRSLITRLKGAGIESLGLFVTPAQIQAFVQQARAVQFMPEYFGIDTFNDAAVQQLFTDQKHGPVFVDAFSDPAFIESYKQRFHDASHAVEAARGALLGKLLLHLGQNAGPSFSRNSLSQALRSFPSGSGPAGAYSINDDSNFGAYLAVEQVLYEISNGKLISSDTRS